MGFAPRGVPARVMGWHEPCRASDCQGYRGVPDAIRIPRVDTRGVNPDPTVPNVRIRGAAALLVAGVICAACGSLLGGGLGGERRSPVSHGSMPFDAAGIVGITGNGRLVWATGTTPMVLNKVDEVLTADGGLIKPHNKSVLAYRRNGSTRWRRSLPCQVGRLVADTRGNLYVGCGWRVASLDPGGRVRWISRPCHWAAPQYIAVSRNGDVYAGGTAGDLDATPDGVCALAPNGATRWQKNVSQVGFGQQDEMRAIAAAADGTLYVGVTGRIAAVTPSGGLRWQHDLDDTTDEIEDILVAPSGTVYALGWDTFSPGSAGFIDALDPGGHRIWWDVATNGFQEGTLAPDGSVYVHTQSQLYRYRG